MKPQFCGQKGQTFSSLSGANATRKGKRQEELNSLLDLENRKEETEIITEDKEYENVQTRRII